VRKREIISWPAVDMLEGMRVRSSFPMFCLCWIAVDWFMYATLYKIPLAMVPSFEYYLLFCYLSGEPMNRNRQSGGTTDMKCSIRGARMGLGRFSIRRATLVSLKGDTYP